MALIFQFPAGTATLPRGAHGTRRFVRVDQPGLAAAGIDTIVDLSNFRMVADPRAVGADDRHVLLCHD